MTSGRTDGMSSRHSSIYACQVPSPRSTSKTSGTEFSTDYSDFRIVDGLLFALREENTAGGTKTGTNEISKVEVTRVK